MDHTALLSRLVRRTAGRAEVSQTECLLACERSNVVVVVPSSEGRRAGGRPVWLKHVLEEATIDAVVGWLRRGGPGLSPIPVGLRQHETAAPAIVPGSGLWEESLSQ